MIVVDDDPPLSHVRYRGGLDLIRRTNRRRFALEPRDLPDQPSRPGARDPMRPVAIHVHVREPAILDAPIRDDRRVVDGAGPVAAVIGELESVLRLYGKQPDQQCRRDAHP